MKSYTDIEQSKKLAEILPLESADMAYYQWKDDGHLMAPVPFVLDGMEEKNNGFFRYICCWSLSALLSIINNIKGWYPGIDAQVEDNKWQICMFSRETGSDTSLSSMNEELVDVCYEVILKLKERNII